MTIGTGDDRGASVTPPAPERRFAITPLRLACANIVLALVVAAALKALNLPPPERAALPLRDAVSAWMPRNNSQSTFKALGDDAARVREWADGKRRYAETLAVLGPVVPLPPAGAEMAAPFTGTARMLVVNTERELPSNVRLEARSPGEKDGTPVSPLPKQLGPYWESVQIDLRVAIPGGFLRAARESAWRSLTFASASESIVEFADAAEWAPSARVVASWRESSALGDAAREGFAPEVRQADIVNDRADWSLPWRSGYTRPEVHRLENGDGHRNAAIVEVRGRRRYVGVCAWSESGRLPLIRARRSDTQRFVGARGPDVPFFAVMADRFATIQLEVAARSARDIDDLRLIVVTADDPPGLPMFVEAIGHALAPLRVNGVTADAETHRRAGRWLRDALGVTWEARDVAAIAAADKELAAILASLQ